MVDHSPKGNVRQAIGRKIYRKPQSAISEGHGNLSADRACPGAFRVPWLRYLCKIKVEVDFTWQRSEVGIRNENIKIGKGK